jgi:hypothetical protein
MRQRQWQQRMHENKQGIIALVIELCHLETETDKLTHLTAPAKLILIV